MTTKLQQSHNNITTLSQLKESVKKNQMRQKIIDLVEKDPNIGVRAIQKELNITVKTLNESLDRRTEQEKTSKGFNIEKIVGGFLGIDFLFSKGFDTDRESLIESAIDWAREKLTDFPQLVALLGGLWLIIKKAGPDKVNELVIKLIPIAPLLVPLILIGGLLIVIPFLFKKLEPFAAQIIGIFSKWVDLGIDVGEDIVDFVEDVFDAEDVLIKRTDLDCGGKKPKSFKKWWDDKSFWDKTKINADPSANRGEEYIKYVEKWHEKNCVVVEDTGQTVEELATSTGTRR